MSGIHPSAIVERGAIVPESCSVGAFSIIGPEVKLGENVRLHSHVSITGQVEIGDSCEIFPHCVIGQKAQVLGLKSDASRVQIGPRTTLREYVTIHGSSPEMPEPTRVGADCYLMVASHIAHDCQISDKCVLANSTLVGGHCHVGEQVWFGGGSAIHQNTWIGRHAFIGGGSLVVGDVVPFVSTIGNHAYAASLNAVGLRRRGFTKSDLTQIRLVLKTIFQGDEDRLSRLETARQAYGDTDFGREIIAFIESPRNGRPLCQYRVAK